jgi:hypothetical protein
MVIPMEVIAVVDIEVVTGHRPHFAIRPQQRDFQRPVEIPEIKLAAIIFRKQWPQIGVREAAWAMSKRMLET